MSIMFSLVTWKVGTDLWISNIFQVNGYFDEIKIELNLYVITGRIWVIHQIDKFGLDSIQTGCVRLNRHQCRLNYSVSVTQPKQKSFRSREVEIKFDCALYCVDVYVVQISVQLTEEKFVYRHQACKQWNCQWSHKHQDCANSCNWEAVLKRMMF